jgi:hypothetical protein
LVSLEFGRTLAELRSVEAAAGQRRLLLPFTELPYEPVDNGDGQVEWRAKLDYQARIWD